ncbi:unnamed protein product [Amoebophrya sp. A25]|nr:unnamed protein product [Amoebophrya sp. A25]|eukprot:GSA25T00000323001.1
MAAVPVDQLTPEQKGELLCTYAALILHDDGAEITADSLNTLIKAAGCSCEAYFPALFAKMASNQDIGAILKAGGGGGGGGGGGAAAGGAAAGGDAGGAAEEKKEEKVEEEEDDMEFDLFD